MIPSPWEDRGVDERFEAKVYLLFRTILLYMLEAGA
jgi:hypothetical protein